MTYALTIEIDAPTLPLAAAAAWDILQGRAGIPYTIRAVPPPAAQCQAQQAPPRVWTAEEARCIAAGVVPARLRYDAEFVAAVKTAAQV